MFYKAKVRVSTEDDRGKIKKSTWEYIVAAVSVTDVEVIVTTHMMGSVNDWELVSVSDTRIIEILNAGTK